MASEHSVTRWMQALQAGDTSAAQHLWEHYFSAMVGLAERRLSRQARRAFDEEDVALSAFNSFCEGARDGSFPHLSAREDLWRLLVVITARKAKTYQRHANRRKRGGGQVVGESDLARAGDDEAAGFEAIIGSAPTPALLVQIAEQFTRLLDRLPSDELRRVAVLKMEGHTVEEIAAQLRLSHRAVERRLQEIRSLWGQDS